MRIWCLRGCHESHGNAASGTRGRAGWRGLALGGRSAASGGGRTVASAAADSVDWAHERPPLAPPGGPGDPPPARGGGIADVGGGRWCRRRSVEPVLVRAGAGPARPRLAPARRLPAPVGRGAAGAAVLL